MLKINKSLSQPNTITKKQSKSPSLFFYNTTLFDPEEGEPQKGTAKICVHVRCLEVFSVLSHHHENQFHVFAFLTEHRFFFDLRLRLISSILAVHVQKPVYHAIGGESRRFEQ